MKKKEIRLPGASVSPLWCGFFLINPLLYTLIFAGLLASYILRCLSITTVSFRVYFRCLLGTCKLAPLLSMSMISTTKNHWDSEDGRERERQWGESPRGIRVPEDVKSCNLMRLIYGAKKLKPRRRNQYGTIKVRLDTYQQQQKKKNVISSLALSPARRHTQEKRINFEKKEIYIYTVCLFALFGQVSRINNKNGYTHR